MNPPGTIHEILVQKRPDIWCVSPEATVFEAIQIMADKNIGALLVTAQDKLIGILTERDYTRKVALRGKVSKQTKVKEIVSGEVITVTPEHTVEECMRLMTANRVRHLPVLSGPDILGIVSIGDLVNWTISAQNRTIDQLRTYITGYPE
jgi:CBS domain-containing protein